MPEWEQGRYISLLGDPIGRDGKPLSALKSTLSNTDGKTLGIATTLESALLTKFNTSLDEVMFYSLLTLASGAFFCRQGRDFETNCLTRIFNNAMLEKCIDTRPDANVFPTLDKYVLKATEAKFLYCFMEVATPVLGVMLSGTLSGLVGMPQQLTASLSGYPICAEMARALSGYNRFGKVLTGDHIIVDMPKPKPVEEKVETLSFAGMQA